MKPLDYDHPSYLSEPEDRDCIDTTCAEEDEEIEIDLESFFDAHGRELGATICMRGHDVLWVEAWDVDGKDVQLDWVTREAIVTEALR